MMMGPYYTLMPWLKCARWMRSEISYEYFLACKQTKKTAQVHKQNACKKRIIFTGSMSIVNCAVGIHFSETKSVLSIAIKLATYFVWLGTWLFCTSPFSKENWRRKLGLLFKNKYYCAHQNLDICAEQIQVTSKPTKVVWWYLTEHNLFRPTCLHHRLVKCSLRQKPLCRLYCQLWSQKKYLLHDKGHNVKQ